MITSISLNPSIDRTLEVDSFTTGGLNRVKKQTDVAAGKGTNVALAAAALGERSECIGFMYQEGGRLFEERLANGGVGCDFLWCDGAVRVNVKVFDRARGEITELNQSGTPVTEQQLQQMTDLVLRHARETDFLVLTGSLPPACPADYYRTLAEAAAGENCRVLLDADGDRLRAGIGAKPFLIKPNRYELELLTGRTLDTTAKLLDAAEECIEAGVGVVAVSMGGEGALITDGREAWRTPGLKIDVKSTVAAGDSMIAGLAAGFGRGYDLQHAFRLGVAAATARCATAPERIIDADTCLRYAGQLEMERIK
ncbi:MAG: 1-phosphofructokinase family hexose kinase [Clostridia bacterium]|nr:1-phosphofructokinase family hexose kinase [Clostridia bacterium]